MAWKHVDTVYHGGSEELKTLRDALVRTRCAISGLPIHKGEGTPPDDAADLSSGQFGRVALPYKEMALIAFLRRPMEVPPLLEKLRYGEFFVVRVNWATFRTQFDIELP